MKAMCLLIGLFMALPLGARTLHVPEGYETIQQAIEASAAGDTVLVAPGTYTGSVDFSARDIVLASRWILTEERVYIESTIIDAGGAAFAVRFAGGETAAAQLVGFTIRGAGAAGVEIEDKPHGAAILCLDASPTIRANTITGNVSQFWDYNGAIVCRNSSALIRDNHIVDNQGGMGYSISAGIVAYRSNIHIVNTCIERQYTPFSRWAAGIYIEECNPRIERTIIRANNGGYVFNGAGILCRNAGPEISYTVIDNNRYDLRQAGVLSVFSSPVLRNVTIADHVHGIHAEQSGLTAAVNVIVYACDVAIVKEDEVCAVELKYSNIQDGYEGPGNITADPLFTDTANGDYTLNPYSPCIDTGDPDSPHDPDGSPADIGAFPYWGWITNVEHERGFQPSLLLPEPPVPNPLQEYSYIGFVLAEAAHVHIEICDTQGKVVHAHNTGLLPAGPHRFVWQPERSGVHTVRNGVYFVRLQARSMTCSQSAGLQLLLR